MISQELMQPGLGCLVPSGRIACWRLVTHDVDTTCLFANASGILNGLECNVKTDFLQATGKPQRLIGHP